MSEPIMTQLRAATAQEHHDLEEVVAVGERLRSGASYQRLLEGFYGIVSPIEKSLAKADWQNVGISFAERQKTSLLKADLEELGVKADQLKQSDDLPELDTLGKACGALYVLEGSTLGGQHILRMAQAASLNPNAMQYFRSYGAMVGEMWKSLGAALNGFAEKSGQSSEMIEGARMTFRAFQSWFQSCLCAR